MEKISVYLHVMEEEIGIRRAQRYYSLYLLEQVECPIDDVLFILDISVHLLIYVNTYCNSDTLIH